MIVKLLTGRRQAWWYSLLAVLITAALMSLVGAWWTKTQVDRAMRKLCESVVAADEAYQQPRPPGIPDSPTRQRLAKANHQLRLDLKCDAR